MKLYFSRGACSLTPRILINELQIPCEFESVDLKTKKTEKNNNYLEINPKGSVPVIETDEKQILTENAVILQYLADTYSDGKLLPKIGDFKRYRVLEWLNYVSTEIHKRFSPLFNNDIPQELKDSIFIPLLSKKFAFINKHLESNGNSYLLGNDFTIPDAYLCVTLLWSSKFPLKIESLTHLNDYFSRLKARPSIQQAFTDEGLKVNNG